MLSATIAFADEPRQVPEYGPEDKYRSAAAGCAPATAQKFLELNSVRALIVTGGSQWHVSGDAVGRYYVPKESGRSMFWSGALWLAGVDANDQLKIAAVMYQNGNDIWTGPLTADGTAEIDAATCDQYNKLFVIKRQDVEQFAGW